MVSAGVGAPWLEQPVHSSNETYLAHQLQHFPLPKVRLVALHSGATPKPQAQACIYTAYTVQTLTCCTEVRENSFCRMPQTATPSRQYPKHTSIAQPSHCQDWGHRSLLQVDFYSQKRWPMELWKASLRSLSNSGRQVTAFARPSARLRPAAGSRCKMVLDTITSDLLTALWKQHAG